MHARVFEIESKKGYLNGWEDELPEWWTNYYSDWYSEEVDEDCKESIEWLADEVDVKDGVVDFDGEKGKTRLGKSYDSVKDILRQMETLTYDDFCEYAGLDLAHRLASEAEDKFHHWFYIDGSDMCTLDEMLHRGGKFYLTGRTWDYHY